MGLFVAVSLFYDMLVCLCVCVVVVVVLLFCLLLVHVVLLG